MTRKECLDAAAGCVLKDRQNQYGGPENNFERIAQMWNGYLGTNSIKPWDVAAMMILLKMARARFNPKYEDNWADAAGYAACGIECATAQEEFDKALDKHQQEIFDRMFNKAGGNHPENPDSSTEAKPEFKFRDKVQARLGDGVWRDAVVSDKEITCGKLYYTVKVADFNGYYSLQADDVRPVPKAEGCEELVQKDAPQTPDELYDRILSVNPATFHTPSYAEEQLEHHSRQQARTPTGEELAEMAETEEDA